MVVNVSRWNCHLGMFKGYVSNFKTQAHDIAYLYLIVSHELYPYYIPIVIGFYLEDHLMILVGAW